MRYFSWRKDKAPPSLTEVPGREFQAEEWGNRHANLGGLRGYSKGVIQGEGIVSIARRRPQVSAHQKWGGVIS